MGVDYDGVGGIGIELTEEMVERAIDKGVFTEDAWDYDPGECLDQLGGFYYSHAGSSYGGDTFFYLFVPGPTLGEINEKAPRFVSKIKEYFGVNIDVDDLKVISDIYIW